MNTGNVIIQANQRHVAACEEIGNRAVTISHAIPRLNAPLFYDSWNKISNLFIATTYVRTHTYR